MTFSPSASVGSAARRPRRVPGRATQNVGPGIMPGPTHVTPLGFKPKTFRTGI